MSLRENSLALIYYRFIDKTFLPVLKNLAITPNQYSLIGLLLAIAVPIGFFLDPGLGLGLIVLSGFADTLDGIIARRRRTASQIGAFIDSTFDRISDFCYLFGIWVLFWQMQGIILSSALIFVSFLMTFMVSYVKARATTLGVSCDIGWMERGYRTLYLIVWVMLICILPGYRNMILWSGLVLYLVLTSATALQRIIQTRSKLLP